MAVFPCLAKWLVLEPGLHVTSTQVNPSHSWQTLWASVHAWLRPQQPVPREGDRHRPAARPMPPWPAPQSPWLLGAVGLALLAEGGSPPQAVMRCGCVVALWFATVQAPPPILEISRGWGGGGSGAVPPPRWEVPRRMPGHVFRHKAPKMSLGNVL